VQKLSIKKTVLLEKMVILFSWELCNTFTQSISFPEYACSKLKCPRVHDRQTVIFCFIKSMNGIKKHERILKELKWVLTVVIYWISCI
jgi:hypothetical protein